MKRTTERNPALSGNPSRTAGTAALVASAFIVLAFSTISCNRAGRFKTETVCVEDSLSLAGETGAAADGANGIGSGSAAGGVADVAANAALHIDINVEYAAGGASDKVIESVNGIIAEMLFEEDELTDVNGACSKYVGNLKKNYRESCKEIIEIYEGFGESMIPAICNWDISVRGQFLDPYKEPDSRKKYIPYRTDTYNYMGGAHGSRTVLCRNFSVESGNAAAEDDIFKGDYESRLTELLIEGATETVGEENAGALWVQEIRPNGNFVLTKDGILYIFNQYEIAPYALGVIEVMIPWSKVADLLK